MSSRAEHADAQARPLVLSQLGWGLLNAVQLVYTLTWTAGWITLALLTRVVTRSHRWSLRMAARCWAPGLLWGAGATLQVEGIERVDWSRPYVLVANHRSMIDICALFRAVPVPLRFMLKRELAGVPFLGRYARAMGMIFVERTAGRSAGIQLRRAVELVRGGASLCAFPEGTRVRADHLAPFQAGAFRVAIQAGAAVLPVAVSGSGFVLPPGGFRVRPGRIRVHIGEPLPAAGLRPDQRGELARQARQAVLDLLQQGPLRR
ncbi:MAG: lysophospholipid acyltransferase family protein [Thermoanaerobaculia bacterium]